MAKLGLDIGYGYTKYCILDDKGKIHYDKIVSGVCKVPDSSYSELTDKDSYYIFKDKKYLIGDLSSMLMEAPIDVMTYEGYKEVSAVITSYMLHIHRNYNIEEIRLGLTPAMWDKKDEYLDYICNELGISKDKVAIKIQGLSGHQCYKKYGVDPSSDENQSQYISDNYVGLDIGHNTLDFYIVLDGKVLDYGIKGFLKRGACIITDNIKKHVQSEYGYEINDVEAKAVLNTGLLKRRRRIIDLKNKVNQFILNYLESTLELVEQEYGVQLDKVDQILIFGGGGEIIKLACETSEEFKAQLEELYGDGYLLIPRNGSSFYNCIGYTL